MKRAQIQRHRLMWLLMIPALAATIVAGLMVKSSGEVPANDTLPSFLTESD